MMFLNQSNQSFRIKQSKEWIKLRSSWTIKLFKSKAKAIIDFPFYIKKVLKISILFILGIKDRIIAVKADYIHSNLSDFDRLAVERGRELIKIRSELGLSQSEVSNVTGIAYLQEIEDGMDCFLIKDYKVLASFYQTKKKESVNRIVIDKE
jgi:hypothetical protein